MTYSIVNAFLNNITFSSSEVEALLLAALYDNTWLTREIYANAVEFSHTFASTTHMA